MENTELFDFLLKDDPIADQIFGVRNIISLFNSDFQYSSDKKCYDLREAIYNKKILVHCVVNTHILGDAIDDPIISIGVTYLFEKEEYMVLPLNYKKDTSYIPVMPSLNTINSLNYKSYISLTNILSNKEYNPFQKNQNLYDIVDLKNILTDIISSSDRIWVDGNIRNTTRFCLHVERICNNNILKIYDYKFRNCIDLYEMSNTYFDESLYNNKDDDARTKSILRAITIRDAKNKLRSLKKVDCK